MSKYEKIAEVLQERVNNGELTLEDANRLNDLAYSKYVTEAENENKDVELVEELLEKVKGGLKLSKDAKKEIKDLLEEAEEENNEDDVEDGTKEDEEVPAEDETAE